MNVYTISFEYVEPIDYTVIDSVRNFLDSKNVPSYFDLYGIEQDEDGTISYFSSFEANVTFAQATDLLYRLRSSGQNIKSVSVYPLQNVSNFDLGTPIKHYEF